MQAPKPVARRSGVSVHVETEQVEHPMFQDNRSVDLDADAHGGGGEDGYAEDDEVNTEGGENLSNTSSTKPESNDEEEHRKWERRQKKRLQHQQMEHGYEEEDCWEVVYSDEVARC